MRTIVDMGSNSVKLLSARRSKVGTMEVVSTKSYITRLGKDLKKNQGQLNSKSIEDSIKALQEMGNHLSELRQDPKELLVVGTSALRDCKDPSPIAEAVKKYLHSSLVILSGKEEAHYSTLGANFAAQLVSPSSQVPLFVDVGGASTEVGGLKPQPWGHSFFVGALRFYNEAFDGKDKLSDAEWNPIQNKIADYFPEDVIQSLKTNSPSPDLFVGIGGTLVLATRLIDSAVKNEYGSIVKTKDLKALNETLRKMTLDERRALPNMERGREDIIVAGLLCLTHVLDLWKAEECFVTQWGLRHGLWNNYPI